MDRWLFLGVVLCLTLPVARVEGKVKFKSLTKKEIAIERCEFFPDARAMILEKKGDILLDARVSSERGSTGNGVQFFYVYSEGARIKIFTEEGKKDGDIRFRLYSPESGPLREDMVSVEGYTYKLEDGGIKKYKLEKSGIYTNRLNEFWIEVVLAFPNVEAGVVLEYVYVMRSNLLSNLKTWFFQSDIPTLENELTYCVPDYFNYQSRVLGNTYPLEQKEEIMVDKLGDYDVNKVIRKLKISNVPPVEEEPFVSNPCDLPMRMDFQLFSTMFPGEKMKIVAGTYEKFNEELVKKENFGLAIRGTGLSRELKPGLEGLDDGAKARRVFEWIGQRVKWNGQPGVVLQSGLRSCLNAGIGNAADVNLTYVAACREQGLDAYPVLLSTRGHGLIHPTYPNFEDFNYVIAAVQVEDKYLLCDATNPRSFGLLPVRCLNGSGWLVREGGGEMIPLRGGGTDLLSVTTEITFGGDKMKACVVATGREYAALAFQAKLDEGGEERFADELKERFQDYELTDYTLARGEEEMMQQFKLSCPLEQGDHIFVHPFLYGLPGSSPFKRDARVAVVDFPYGSRTTVTAKVEIPEGYEAELPESYYTILESKGALFSFDVLSDGKYITLKACVIVKKLIYTSEEYPELKAFYDQITEASRTVVVFKKKG